MIRLCGSGTGAWILLLVLTATRLAAADSLLPAPAGTGHAGLPRQGFQEELPLAPIDWEQSRSDGGVFGANGPARIDRDRSLLSPPRRSSDVREEEELETITERYDDRSVKIRRQVKQDEQRNYVNHGQWTMLDRQGKLIAQGEYRDGKRHGSWMRVVPSAVGLPAGFQSPFVSRAEFADDQLHGQWTITDAHQRIVATWEFEHGRLNGQVSAWTPEGHPKSEMTFVQGQPHGIATHYAATGAVERKEYYRDGKQLVPVVQRYDRQQKESEGWLLRSNFEYETTVDWWSNFVQIARVPNDGGDVRIGRWKQWHPNGNLKFEGSFADGRPEGRHTWWHENGQKSATGVYRDGEQHLTWTFWHTNGHKEEEGRFLAGVKTGTWDRWEEDGTLIGTEQPDTDTGLVADETLPEPELSLDPAVIRRPGVEILTGSARDGFPISD